MNIDQLYKVFLQSAGISTDSRRVTPGSIFFALTGDNFDGNIYASDALSSGASCAVVDKREVISDDRYILAENALTTLQELANHHRKSLGIPVLAITGTNGKTTTKELIGLVLNKKFRVGVTQGNLNNHIGVPLTLLSMNENTEIGIVEMGANHPGEIDQLCRIAEPDFGLITNIGKAHLHGFGSFEGVIQTKTELYRFVEKRGGIIFFNSDNELLVNLTKRNNKTISYGSAKNCFLRAELIDHIPFLKVKTWFNNEIVEFSTQLTGSYNFENIAAAACTGYYFGVDQLLIKEAIDNYIPKNNRSQVIEKGTNKIILDAYNANPSSMMASISNFLDYPDPNKTIIIGDMLELGNYSVTEHQSIVDFIKNIGFVRIILVGDHFGSTSRTSEIISLRNVKELEDYLIDNPIKNNLILLKGSRGIQLEKALASI